MSHPTDAEDAIDPHRRQALNLVGAGLAGASALRKRMRARSSR